VSQPKCAQAEKWVPRAPLHIETWYARPPVSGLAWDDVDGSKATAGFRILRP